MVLYNYHSNTILVTAIKGRKGPEILEGYKKLYNKLEAAGIKSVMQQLDNEALDSFVASITEKEMKYQLAAPYNHSPNSAERAIQSFKDHLISNLHGTNQGFAMYQWDCIIECRMTLNMLQRSCINPKLSDYMQMFGVFNYNAIPLLSIGTKAFIYKRPKQRGIFTDHGKTSFVIGPVMEHY